MGNSHNLIKMGIMYRTLLGYRCPASIKVLGLVLSAGLLVTACATLGHPADEPPERLIPRDPKAKAAVRPTELIDVLAVEVAAWPQFAPAAASLTFDDGTRDQYMVAAPILRAHGIRATFFLISHKMDKGVWNDHGNLRKLMTWEEATHLAASGHELGSHSATHSDLSVPGSDLELELGESRRRIEKRVPGVRVDTFAWPYWRSTPEAREIASRVYIAARGGAAIPEQFNALSRENPSTNTPNDFLNVNSMGIRPTDSAREWKHIVGDVVERGGWAVFSLHGIDNGATPADELGWAPISEEDLDTILQEMRERDLWIAPFGEVAAYALHREAAELSLLRLDDGRVRLSLSGDPQANHSNVPLTIRIRANHGTPNTTITVNTTAEARRDKEGAWVLSMRPGKESVVIEW